MQVEIKLNNKPNSTISNLFVINAKTNLDELGIDKKQQAYIKKEFKDKTYFYTLNQYNSLIFIQFIEEFEKNDKYSKLESLRLLGNKIYAPLNSGKYSKLQINDFADIKSEAIAIAEGCALGSYKFLKYKSEKKNENKLETIYIKAAGVAIEDINHLNITIEAVFYARDMVNEPQSYLDAVTFSQEIKKLGKKSGFKVEVLNKSQIKALKMGGLLAVNQGSQTPPTFNILEWKPTKCKNKKPLVLVGKGVVYDTGGLSLKPTPNSMDTMKCDMAGGAVVAATMYAVAKANLPYYIIGLIPATDNRPGENAYTPGDVVKMFDGQTVEVLNTDAEGRMLLADALSYAKKYKPELVLDFATLTGAAAAAIGQYGIVCMGTADESRKSELKESGSAVHERLVEFPFWDDYGKLIKSDLADMKNIGGPVAGAITAGKFLEKFIDYQWMHFDIAGPAYINSEDGYRGKNGTGVGVRFMFDFIKKLAKK